MSSNENNPASQNELKFIALGDIRPNPVALRQVDKDGVAYNEIVNTIPLVGILNPISVRWVTQTITDEEGNPILDDAGVEISESFYKLVDGLHRYTAATEAGLEEIPCQILTGAMDETAELSAQVIANLMRVETKNSEFTRQIVRLLQKNPTWTESDIAEKLGASTSFIKARLSLQKITNEEIHTLIDNGTIPMSNAYALAKLPPAHHAEFVQQAIEQSAAEFSGLIKARVKEINAAKREGREASDEFKGAVPRGRKVTELTGILENGDVSDIVRLVEGETKEEIVLSVLKWAVHLDNDSVDVARAKHEEAVAQRMEAKRKRAESAAKREAARKLEKAEKARAAAEKAAAEANAALEG